MNKREFSFSPSEIQYNDSADIFGVESTGNVVGLYKSIIFFFAVMAMFIINWGFLD